MTVAITVLLGVVLLLAGVVVFQQVFFTKQIQTLVDKLMSRSFQEYTTTIKPPPPKVVINEEIPEDLRALQAFQM